MSTVYIHAPEGIVSRSIAKCPHCKQVRRRLYWSFQWYAGHFICGGCGWTNQHRTTQRQRLKNIERVKREWPTALTQR